MGNLYPNHGNSLVIVALQTSGAAPTAFTLWTGTAGNCIKFNSFVQGKSDAPIESNYSLYKTNDDEPYADKDELTAKIKGNLYDNTELVATWFETAIPTFKAAGRKFLFIYNMGKKITKWKEVYMVGTMSSAQSDPDNQPDNAMPVDCTSAPPSSALTLTTTQLAAINTAVGAATIKGAAASKTIPAAGGVNKRLLAFTTAS